MTHVYEFRFNDSVLESAYYTVSIHRTIEGAYNAFRKHRLQHFNEWYRFGKKYRKDLPEAYDSGWRIRKTELKP